MHRWATGHTHRSHTAGRSWSFPKWGNGGNAGASQWTSFQRGLTVQPAAARGHVSLVSHRSHTLAHRNTPQRGDQIRTNKSSHQTENKLPFLHSNSDGSAVALHCFVVYCNFSQGLFISLQASFYGAAFGARTRACLGITHQSFSRPDLRGHCRGRRRGEVGPLQSPLCGPWWHLLMRDATHTPMRSFLPDLSSS